MRPARLGSATCRTIQHRPSIGKNLVKIVLLDHKILKNCVTLCKNVGRQRGWDIAVHGGGGAPLNNQMVGHGLMSLGRQTNRIMMVLAASRTRGKSGRWLIWSLAHGYANNGNKS